MCVLCVLAFVLCACVYECVCMRACVCALCVCMCVCVHVCVLLCVHKLCVCVCVCVCVRERERERESVCAGACSYRAVTGVDRKSLSRPPCFLRDIDTTMQQVRTSGDCGLERRTRLQPIRYKNFVNS